MSALLVGIALLISPAQAQTACGKTARTSPCMPSAAEQAALMTIIGTAVEQRQAWEAAKKKEHDLRQSIWERHSLNYPEWRKAYELMEANEKVMRATFARVLRETQRVYGVDPKMKSGTVQGGHLVGQSALWKPVIKTESSLYMVPRAGKPTVYLKYSHDPDQAGGTLDDGQVVISYEALLRAQVNGTPAILAAVIDHEGDHFDKLVGEKGGWNAYDSVEASAYARELETADAIGLEEHERNLVKRLHARHYFRALARELRDSAQGREYSAAPLSGDYPYVPKPETHYKEWTDYQAGLDRIKAEREELNKRLAAVQRGEPAEWPDSSDKRRPAQGSDRSNGCGGEGWWAGEIYMPPLPCGQMIYKPAPRGIPAHASPLPPGATAVPSQPPHRAVAAVRLSDLATRICADPAVARSESAHSEYRAASYDPNDDGNSLADCPREVFLVLKKIRRDGYPDFNTQYFEDLVRNSRDGHSSPDADIAEPRGRGGPGYGDPCAETGRFGGVPTGCR